MTTMTAPDLDIPTSDTDGLSPDSAIPLCSGIEWLQPLRDHGQTRFHELGGLPDRHDERWRYTPLKPIVTQSFVLWDDERPAVSAEDLASFTVPGLDAIDLVFVNGVFAPELSGDPAQLGPAVTCVPLDRAARDHRDLLEPALNRLAGDSPHPFTALNSAHLRDGVFVHVPDGVAAAKPLRILSIATTTNDPTTFVAAHPRNVVVAGQEASVTVLEHYVTTDPDLVYLNNAVTELFAAERAEVEHYLLEQESQAAFNISTLNIQLAEKSDVKSHTVLLGGAIIRNNVEPTFQGTDSECLINGLYVGHRKQLLDNAMHVVHDAPGCRSRQHYKGIMMDEARGVFTGRILVTENGQQTDAVQSSRSMLLSDDARINARPQLEIYADDVKCTHGATTGHVDPEAVFYFRSRGLSEEVARAMLIYAFSAEGFDRMDLQPVRQLLAQQMIDKLPKAKGLSIEV
ncbi:MAG: Fe-S cluster assembly protein SufD [Planctomycetota bacterium]